MIVVGGSGCDRGIVSAVGISVVGGESGERKRERDIVYMYILNCLSRLSKVDRN